MLYHAQNSTPRMLTGLMVVAAIHVAAIVAFKSGLVQDITIPVILKTTPVIVIDVPSKPPPPPPPPSRPVFLQRHISMPAMPDIPDIAPEALVSTAIAVGPSPIEVSAPAAAGAGPEISEFQVDSNFPLTRPDYPWQSIRMNEEGTVVLMLYVLPNGRVGEVRVEQSSGHRRLDESALREARRGWRFKPRTVGDRAVGAWGTYAVRFTLD